MSRNFYKKQEKQAKRDFKRELSDFSKDQMEKYNKQSDQDFLRRHNTEYNIFDKFNDYCTEKLYKFRVGYVPFGHMAATSGRITRNNYETYYERSPFTDGY